MGNCSCFAPSRNRLPPGPAIIFQRGNAIRFSYEELAKATNNFSPKLFLGKGGFGPVFKGQLQNTGQKVAVKQFDTRGGRTIYEFSHETRLLADLDHPNIIKLIGYCSEGESVISEWQNRLIVYELMPLGSLQTRLHDLKPEMQPLDWNTRMKIANGIAKALNYLHTDCRIIYRELKSSNILLGQGFHTKLSDFGGTHDFYTSDGASVYIRILETNGYCPPEYINNGTVRTSMDVYGFGVLLFELITGREPLTETRGEGTQLLTEWVSANFSPEDYDNLVDPLLKGKFPKKMLRVVLEMAFSCVEINPMKRPHMSEIVQGLDHLTPYDPNADQGMDKPETITNCLTLYDPNADPEVDSDDTRFEDDLVVNNAENWYADYFLA